MNDGGCTALLLALGLGFGSQDGIEEGPARGIIPDAEYERVLAAAPEAASVEPKAKRRLLIYSRCYGFIHSGIPYGKVAFSILGDKTGAWESELHDDLEVFEKENLARFDAIFFNNTNNEIFLPEDYESLGEEAKRAAEVVDARLKQNLLDYVAAGGGFAVLHAGVATFRKWPEFGELMGARFENHPWVSGSTVSLKVDDPDHPLAAALRDSALPRITDEIYQLAEPFSREDSRVLLSVDVEATEITPQAAAAFRREDRDFPMTYVRSYGKGRVYYNAFGHQHDVFWNPVVLRHWLDGIQFVLGDLEGDMTPSNPPASPGADFAWDQSEDSYALRRGGTTVWKLRRDREIGKAYFHPVSLLDGTKLTWLNPPDHVWHRGLWFEWKFIDGVNYWEEIPDKGRTEIPEFHANLADDFSARFRMTIDYRPPSGEAVLQERRLIRVLPPDADGTYRIDWTGTFRALSKDLLLDRTPPEDQPDGQSWGGYSGMSVRIAEEMREWRITDSEGREGLDCHRQPARWIRGDFAHGETGSEGGIAILDHPGNLRHPTPSFVVMPGKEAFVYYSPAPLFEEPLLLAAGKSLTLRYRIVVHAGRAEAEVIDREWEAFAHPAKPARVQDR